jgi:hypothetical protein
MERVSETFVVEKGNLKDFIESRLNEILDGLDIDDELVTVSETGAIADELTTELMNQYAIFSKLPIKVV